MEEGFGRYDEEAARKLERYRQIEQVSAIKLQIQRQLVDEAKKRKSDAEEAADASKSAAKNCRTS